MRKILLSVCLLICLVTLSFAAWNLYGHYRTYQDGKKEYEEMKDFIRMNRFRTTPMYEAYMRLKKSMAAAIRWNPGR